MAHVNTHIYEQSFWSIFIFKNKCLLKRRNHLQIFLFYGRPHDPGLHDKVLSPCKLSLPLLCSFDGTQQDELMASEHRGEKRRDEELTALLSKTEAFRGRSGEGRRMLWAEPIPSRKRQVNAFLSLNVVPMGNSLPDILSWSHGGSSKAAGLSKCLSTIYVSAQTHWVLHWLLWSFERECPEVLTFEYLVPTW